MDEPVDLRRRTKVEKMTQQEFLQHVNALRDTTIAVHCPKNIDRLFLNSAMQLYVDVATHIRYQGAWNQHYAPHVPDEANACQADTDFHHRRQTLQTMADRR